MKIFECPGVLRGKTRLIFFLVDMRWWSMVVWCQCWPASDLIHCLEWDQCTPLCYVMPGDIAHLRVWGSVEKIILSSYHFMVPARNGVPESGSQDAWVDWKDVSSQDVNDAAT